MDPYRLDAVDRETTATWMAGDTFSRGLAWSDLEVYRHDRVKVSVAQLAERWRWTIEDTVDLVRQFLDRFPRRWRPAGLPGRP